MGGDRCAAWQMMHCNRISTAVYSTLCTHSFVRTHGPADTQNTRAAQYSGQKLCGLGTSSCFHLCAHAAVPGMRRRRPDGERMLFVCASVAGRPVRIGGRLQDRTTDTAGMQSHVRGRDVTGMSSCLSRPGPPVDATAMFGASGALPASPLLSVAVAASAGKLGWAVAWWESARSPAAIAAVLIIVMVQVSSLTEGQGGRRTR